MATYSGYWRHAAAAAAARTRARRATMEKMLNLGSVTSRPKSTASGEDDGLETLRIDAVKIDRKSLAAGVDIRLPELVRGKRMMGQNDGEVEEEKEEGDGDGDGSGRGRVLMSRRQKDGKLMRITVVLPQCSL
jgi:hypothetical protein